MAAVRPEEAVLLQMVVPLEVVHQAVVLPVVAHPAVVLQQQEMAQQEREHQTLHRYLPS